jgi:hypothetical protein
MIGQHGDGIDLHRPASDTLPQQVSQQLDCPRLAQERSASVGHHCEEKRSAGDEGSAEVGHEG